MALADRPPPYGTIVFDCDSTLSAIEGVEELASPSQRAEIEELTRRAMDGGEPLEAVFGRRLELVRPTREALAVVGRRYVERAQPHAREVLALLRAAGKRLVIVSGGLRPAVEPFAAWLGVEEVHAVGVRFDAAGAYAGFEEDSPLARAGGKPRVLRSLAAGPEGAALVGDGVTDLEAAGEVARFVAYGGVVRREAVFRAASARCEAADFRALVPLLLADAEIATLARQEAHRSLLQPLRPR